MRSLLIKNAQIVNEGQIFESDIYCENGLIQKIAKNIRKAADVKVKAKGLMLLPGIIDDQVHFREPGLTHKGDLYSESRAAVAGGITSFMEMPNTKPQTLTQELLEKKYERAAEVSAANYSFFMGASNDNLEEVLKTDIKQVCGVKVFMGSSTGNMLVDDAEVLEKIFSQSPMLVATHCEKEEIIRRNLKLYKDQFGENIPVGEHPYIRSADACFQSSRLAVELAKKYNTRLHILHISTARELELFDNKLPLAEKRITAEVCIHHLWFSEEDYAEKGMFIKWNPAVKKKSDREALRKALIDNRLDIIATDHAPHTLEEKNNNYTSAPSGGPLVQHALVAVLELTKQGVLSVEQAVEKMCHAPAECFQIEKRGYLREGYFADMVLVDPNDPWKVAKKNILYKCGWSPFEGKEFQHKVKQTFVNGQLVYKEGVFDKKVKGKRLSFDR